MEGTSRSGSTNSIFLELIEIINITIPKCKGIEVADVINILKIFKNFWDNTKRSAQT